MRAVPHLLLGEAGDLNEADPLIDRRVRVEELNDSSSSATCSGVLRVAHGLPSSRAARFANQRPICIVRPVSSRRCSASHMSIVIDSI